ncbi:hypothetical protein HYX10_05525 [Candidatus Woesearchaeota archaeon]|nr:hypothetical protein [Candidatus Woesearchaeota archaeon]
MFALDIKMILTVVGVGVVILFASSIIADSGGIAEAAVKELKSRFGAAPPYLKEFIVFKDGEDAAGAAYVLVGNFDMIREVKVTDVASKMADDIPSGAGTAVDQFSLANDKDAAGILRENSGSIRFESLKNPVKPSPGLHRYTIEVFLKNSDVIFDDYVVGFYDEGYVELYENAVDGCPGPDKCKVTECKKQLIANDAKKRLSDLGIMKEIADSSCADLSSEGVFDVSSCNSIGIDRINRDFAGLRLLRLAREDKSKSVDTELDYSQFSCDEFADLKDKAVKETFSCGDNLKTFLKSRGWLELGSFVQESEINKKLDLPGCS